MTRSQKFRRLGLAAALAVLSVATINMPASSALPAPCFGGYVCLYDGYDSRNGPTGKPVKFRLGSLDLASHNFDNKAVYIVNRTGKTAILYTETGYKGAQYRHVHEIRSGKLEGQFYKNVSSIRVLKSEIPGSPKGRP